MARQEEDEDKGLDGMNHMNHKPKLEATKLMPKFKGESSYYYLMMISSPIVDPTDNIYSTGVTLLSKGWKAVITRNYVTYTLGDTYKSADEAHVAYEAAASAFNENKTFCYKVRQSG